MITHLHIRDFAIIDAIEIDLRTGLTVLTGETGAGKSILVDALQLAAGGRAPQPGQWSAWRVPGYHPRTPRGRPRQWRMRRQAHAAGRCAG